MVKYRDHAVLVSSQFRFAQVAVAIVTCAASSRWHFRRTRRFSPPSAARRRNRSRSMRATSQRIHRETDPASAESISPSETGARSGVAPMIPGRYVRYQTEHELAFVNVGKRERYAPCSEPSEVRIALRGVMLSSCRPDIIGSPDAGWRGERGKSVRMR